MATDVERSGTLVEFRSRVDCVVAMPDGSQLAAEMDVDALYQSLGSIYGISVGAAVRFISESDGKRARIVWIEQKG